MKVQCNPVQIAVITTLLSLAHQKLRSADDLFDIQKDPLHSVNDDFHIM
jgi:hypothetical protein